MLWSNCYGADSVADEEQRGEWLLHVTTASYGVLRGPWVLMICLGAICLEGEGYNAN